MRDAHSQEGKRLVENMQRMIDAPVKPRMISTGAKSDNILFVLDVIHLGSVEWLVSFEVVANASVLRLGRTVGRKHVLTRVENDRCSSK